MITGYSLCGMRIMSAQPLRSFLTISGIAMCIILILFILGVYNGVAEGSIEYIKRTNADIWVLHANSTNMIRGTSLLPTSYTDGIKADTLVGFVAPVLLLLANIDHGDKSATVLLTGYVPGSVGGPPAILKGRRVMSNDEIVLDKAFAAKHGIDTGQTVRIQDSNLRVVGLSTGTNAFVTQYAFVTLAFEQSIIEVPDIASLFIVRVKPGASVQTVKRNLEKTYPGRLSVYPHEEFLRNNIGEMEAGILPLFYAIAAIGGVVLTIILSLILSVYILERRRDFAIMKILGSPKIFLDGMIIKLALSLSLVSEITGVALFYPVIQIIESMSPEVTVQIRPEYIVYITLIACLAGLISALLSCRRIRHIYPLEVYP